MRCRAGVAGQCSGAVNKTLVRRRAADRPAWIGVASVDRPVQFRPTRQSVGNRQARGRAGTAIAQRNGEPDLRARAHADRVSRLGDSHRWCRCRGGSRRRCGRRCWRRCWGGSWSRGRRRSWGWRRSLHRNRNCRRDGIAGIIRNRQANIV